MALAGPAPRAHPLGRERLDEQRDIRHAPDWPNSRLGPLDVDRHVIQQELLQGHRVIPSLSARAG
eukprot:6788582-Pyramimonas_sp.AAC.1